MIGMIASFLEIKKSTTFMFYRLFCLVFKAKRAGLDLGETGY